MVTIMNMGSGSEEELDWVVVKNTPAVAPVLHADMGAGPAYVAPALQTYTEAATTEVAVPNAVILASYSAYFQQ